MEPRYGDTFPTLKNDATRLEGGFRDRCRLFHTIRYSCASRCLAPSITSDPVHPLYGLASSYASDFPGSCPSRRGFLVCDAQARKPCQKDSSASGSRTQRHWIHGNYGEVEGGDEFLLTVTLRFLGAYGLRSRSLKTDNSPTRSMQDRSNRGTRRQQRRNCDGAYIPPHSSPGSSRPF